MFLNVCKQTFYISHMRISQKVKSCFNVKSSTYYFHIKTNTMVDFQICISVPLKSRFKSRLFGLHVMFSLRFSGSKFLMNLRRQFRVRNFFRVRKIFRIKVFPLFAVFNTTFTLKPTITDLKLIWICFKTSSNNIYPFSTVYTRFWKRNNDCFQFSQLHLSMIMITGARWSVKCSKCCKDVWNL